MLQIIKTIKVVGDYDIIKTFNDEAGLLLELKVNYGYEGEYDEENQEFQDALNEMFDEPLHYTMAPKYMNDEHRLTDIQVDTENPEYYYTIRK